MIATGSLGEQQYEVYVLDTSHVPELMTLQQEVVEALPDKAILRPLDEEELLFILQGNGLMIGIFVGDKLIAFRALLEPELDAEHLGYDIGLTTEADLRQVLYQEISNVHPDFRGYGLQRLMAEIVMAQVDSSKHPIICATVMPYNIASLKDKFLQGMHVAALKYKYGGKLRYVFVKYLNEAVVCGEETVDISMGDTEGQQQLLKAGFVGIEMKSAGDDFIVTYRKK